MTRRRSAGAAQSGSARLEPVTVAGRVRAPILEAFAHHAAIGLFLADPDGSAYYFNREACRIIGLPRPRMLDRGWIDALRAEDRERVLRERDRAVARGAVYHPRLRFVHFDGRIVQAELLSVPVRARGRVLVRVGMLTQIADHASPPTVDREVAAGRRWDDLSPQERRVLQLVVEGKTNKAIAAALGLSDKTVKNYLSSAFQKLHIERRSQAAAVYARRGSDAEARRTR